MSWAEWTLLGVVVYIGVTPWVFLGACWAQDRWRLRRQAQQALDEPMARYVDQEGVECVLPQRIVDERRAARKASCLHPIYVLDEGYGEERWGHCLTCGKVLSRADVLARPEPPHERRAR